MADHRFQPETLAIHAGQIPDAATGARALPIYQTTSFVFDSADHAASLFNLQTFGNVYSRLSNPTVAVLEERVAALEGGRAALASASGMAAEAMALLTLLQQGDHVVAAGALYGGSVSMLAVNLARLGIETTFVDGSSSDAFAAAMRPTTRAVFAESLGNPSLAGARHRRRRRRSRTRTACRWSSTTPCRRRSCATRSASAPTSSSTRRPSTSAATARRSPA